MVLYFPSHLISASALHGQTESRKLRFFYLNAECCFVASSEEFNQSLLDFFNFVNFQLILHCCRLIKSCNDFCSALVCWGPYSSGELKLKLRVLRSSCWTVHYTFFKMKDFLIVAFCQHSILIKQHASTSCRVRLHHLLRLQIFFGEIQALCC